MAIDILESGIGYHLCFLFGICQIRLSGLPFDQEQHSIPFTLSHHIYVIFPSLFLFLSRSLVIWY